MGYNAFDIVTLAASSGGIQALGQVLHSLPADFPAPIMLVQHIGSASLGLLPDLLRRSSALPVAYAVQEEPVVRGRVYVAPADQHLFVSPGPTVRLVRGPKVKFCRPAADPLFVSASSVCGPRCLGVILTGACSDGAAGAQAIKWAGGMVLAQSPSSCAASGMPRAAIATGCVDLVLPLDRIGPAIMALVMARGAADFLRVPLQAA